MITHDRGGLHYHLHLVDDKPVGYLSLTLQAKKASGLSGKQWTRYRKDRQRKMNAAAREQAKQQAAAVEAAGQAGVVSE